MNFSDLKFTVHPNGLGKQARHNFSNGYGVSVVISQFSYGGNLGLYELAVIRDGEIVYDTPITDDVVGNLTPEGVTDLLTRIEALPPAQKLHD